MKLGRKNNLCVMIGTFLYYLNSLFCDTHMKEFTDFLAVMWNVILSLDTSHTSYDNRGRMVLSLICLLSVL